MVKVSAINITDKEIERLYSDSKEMLKLKKIYYKLTGKVESSWKGFSEEFSSWLKDNWLYIKDKSKILIEKNRKIISKAAIRVDFKWAPELRFLKTFNRILADKLTNQFVKKGGLIKIDIYDHDFNLEIKEIFSKDCDNRPIQVDNTVQLIVAEDTLISFDTPKIDEEKILKKLKDVVNVSSSIRLDMLENILDLPVSQFVDKISEWKEEFNFKIKDGYIYFTKEDPSELIDKLEKSFALWQKQEMKNNKIMFKISNRELKSTIDENQQVKEDILQMLINLGSQKAIEERKRSLKDFTSRQLIDIKPKRKKDEYDLISKFRTYDLDFLFDSFSSDSLKFIPEDGIIRLFQEADIFKKLNNELGSDDYKKRSKAFNTYQLLLVKQVIPNAIKINLDKNFKDIATILKFQESAEIPFYEGEMKESDRFGKSGRAVQFIFENNQIIKLYVNNPVLRKIENFKDFNTFRYEILGNLQSLNCLEIWDDKFEYIPSSFMNLKRLTHLIIRSPLLLEIPEFIDELESIEDLSLLCENMVDFPNNISKLKNLKHFSLVTIPIMKQAEDSLSSPLKGLTMPSSLWDHNSLRSLHLTCNLTVFPAFIKNLKNLEVLGMHSNLIEEIPEWIGKLTNLAILYLPENKIRNLPESFGKLKKLKELVLNNNQLQYLPESFSKLNNLEDIRLNNNQLQRLPNLFGELLSLKKLFLNDNQITYLPDSIGDLKQLEWLRLSNNRLSQLPENFGNLSNLKTLSLEDNQLKSLPKSIGKLNSLESLSLNNNKLTEIPITIGNLNSLKSLTLQRNKLSDIPKEFDNLKSLEHLIVRENKLTKMERFKDLVNLKDLDLRDNLYSEIKGLEKLVNLKELYIQNNKISEKLINELGGVRMGSGSGSYVKYPIKFIEYCKQRLSSENDVKDFLDTSKNEILEKILKEELKKIDLEDEIYYELIRSDRISKNFTQILNLPTPGGKFWQKGSFLEKLIDVIKKSPLLTEKYIEILDFIKKFPETNRRPILLKLIENSRESDFETYFFEIFKIPEQIVDTWLRVKSFCLVIDAIKRMELFEVHYNYIERVFCEILNNLFEPKVHHIDRISAFYSLIQSFKDTKMLNNQYDLIEEKFKLFLKFDFYDELISLDNYNYKDVEYWRAGTISSLIEKFKNTQLLKNHYKSIEELIYKFVKRVDRIETLLKELHENIT